MLNTNKTSRETDWRLKLHERTITEVLGRYKQNRQFSINIGYMFDYLARSCRLLWNREQAVHIFFNYNPNYKEIHYREIPLHFPDGELEELTEYNRLELQAFVDIKDLAQTIRGYGNRISKNHPKISCVRIFTKEEKEKIKCNKIINQLFSSTNTLNISDPIVLVMDGGEANLGCFILFGKDTSKKQASKPFSNDASSNRTVITWSRTLSSFLRNQVGINSETYLPSFRQRHSAPAVILYGDITNFTQLSSILRIIETNRGTKKVDQLGAIMQKHCSQMSHIVSEHKGRIERFIGDGLMAIFGEHNEHPIVAIGNAVAAANQMVKDLRSRRQEIQNLIYGNGGQNEINEMIELDYSIGINYGTVLYDYLGDERHREYSCIGDHVAFADRLMRKAARFDEDTGDKWPPIVMSQTAEQYFKFWINKNKWGENRGKRILHTKGYGYPSQVYAFDVDIFELDKYERLMDSVRSNKKTEQEIVAELKEAWREE